MSAASAPLPSLGRFLGRALLALLALALVVVLAFFGAVAYLQTPSGTRRVLSLGLGAANDAIAGHVQAEAVTIQGSTILIHRAELLDSEGARVAFIELAEVDIVWAALLEGRVEARRVRLVRPEFSLVVDAEGSNLDRAFARRHPGPDQGGKPVPLSFLVRRFEVELGQLRVQMPQQPPFLAQGLALEGSGRYALRSQAFALDVRGNGGVDSPTSGPLSISLRGERRGLSLSAEADVRAAGASLVAEVHLVGEELLDGQLTLDVAPNLGRALVRNWPLRVPVAMQGQAKREADGYLVSLSAAAGKARLVLRMEADVQNAAARAVSLQLRRVDLAELLGRGPTSDFSARLEGTLRGNSWDAASGNLQLSIPSSQVRGAEVGPVQLALRLDRGRLEVPSLRAALPGLVLEGSGHGTAHSLEGTLHLDVTNLAALSATLGDVLVGLPELGGQGSLRLGFSGHPTHPGVQAEGQFPRLVVGPLSAQAAEVALRLEDVSRPLDANASLSAEALSFGSRTLQQVQATLRREAQAVQLQLTAAGPVQLSLLGTADADSRGLLVETLVLRFPEESWTLAAPAAVRFQPTLQTRRLQLDSDGQSLALTGRLDGQTLEAEVEVQALNLARLPALVAPASWHLAGQLDASASAQGDAKHPDVTARASWVDGGWHGLTGLQARLEGQRSAGQLTVKGHLVALGSALEVDFEGPELSLTKRLHRPVTLHLSAEEVEVGPALCELARAGLLGQGCPGAEAVVSGRASLRASLEGFADEPAVHLLLRTEALRARGLPPLQGTLSLEGDAETPVHLALAAKALQGDVQLQAALDATTGQLLARRRSWAGWRTLGWTADAHASGLQLAPLHEARFLTAPLRGMAALQLSATGTLGAPRGTADVQLQQLEVAPWPMVDAHLVVTAAEAVQATLVLDGPGEEKGSLRLRVEAPLGQLLASASAEELSQAGLSVQGEVGSFDLRDLPFNVNRLRRDRRLLDGKLRLHLEGQGTLLAPSLTATVTATDLGPGGGVHFEGTAKGHYAERQGTVEVQLKSDSGGTLEADGAVQLDLSLPSLRQGLRLAEAPLQARLHSVRFEPDFLASFLPSVRSISGKLQLEGQADGTLGRPGLHGALSWTDGALGIIGFGAYQDIQLRASATSQSFAIEELSARVQGGSVSLTLQGQRGDDGFRVSGALRTKDFPFVVDDQLWCIATLKAELSGTARPWKLELGSVVLSQAELQLPEVRRRNLQELTPPEDVILTRNGVPLDARLAARVLALDPRRRTSQSDQTAASANDVFLTLSLKAPHDVWVRSKDVTLELALSESFRVTLGTETDIHGEVRLLQGRGDVWGRRFEVQPGGDVRFAGAPQQAQLNVTGVYSSVVSQAKVYMHLSGEVSDPKLTPSSDPPMSETEIYTLLATGRTSLVQSNLGSSTSVGGGEAGASILGSWAANQLKTAVGGAIPIDVLSVEVGSDERGYNQTRLEAGKYLTDDIYIGYQARINADAFRYQNANAVRVEYRFLRRWSLQLEYGDANAGSLDAVWSRDY